MSNQKKKVFRYLLPNLLEIQRISFCWFLEVGFLEELKKISILKDNKNKFELILSVRFYKILQPQYTITEARTRDTTYSVRIYTRARLLSLNSSHTTENDVFLCDIPLMTNEGTFLVNGIERVVINQIVRSPGIYYQSKYDKKRNFNYYTASIISNRGRWIKFEIDKTEIINVRIGKAKKLSAYFFLKTLGFDELDFLKFVRTYYFFHTISETVYKLHESFKISFEDVFISDELAFSELQNNLKPHESTTLEAAELLLYSRFFDSKKYDLGSIGRIRVNQKLNQKTSSTVYTLTPNDVFFTVNELIKFRFAPTGQDDIDHLGNRRLRSVGELLQHQVRVGLNRLERIAEERMKSWEPEYVRVNRLINSIPLISSVQEFFVSNPLSQFMDQTNPLAELTHKRRVSVLGPGGISRDQAGFAVRDIHPSQYGRICPVETSEGQNAGLVSSLATYARVNSNGFLETPFYKVKAGKVLRNRFPTYLDAMDEEAHYIASGDVEVSLNGVIKDKIISARYNQDLISLPSTKVEYIAVSPLQVLALGTSLIPFLEHDDANRALMGSNMQRQSVPLLYPEAPLIGTGLESQTAGDSGRTILSASYGKVITTNHEKITVKDKRKTTFIYNLTKYKKSNQGTCINNRTLVFINEKIAVGQTLADGAATEGGELAVGQNIIVAYMPWEGYNYEDAVVISERLVYDDLFTSLHIEKFEIEVRETKFGTEQVTKDLPIIKEYFIRNLDVNGIVKIGAWVNPGDILVGKLTPKGEAEYSPVNKLIQAIYGAKLPNVRNTSFKLPKGISGRVLDIKFFSNSSHATLPSGIDKILKIYVAQKRKLQIGDKMAGRHGNKGIISKILAREDMPYLPDGTSIDMLLNPLGVPSRMNVGQIFECLLGFAAKNLSVRFKVVPFDEMYGPDASQILINRKLKEASIVKPWVFSERHPGKVSLRDGRNSQIFENPVTVGFSYMLKLVHLVDDKIHARSTGPYSLVTQQPLGGRSKKGGQRVGEMEVWALEAFGAAFTLREILTIKSDDMKGRNETLNAIVKGLPMPIPRTPESFKVLIRELQALCLDISLHKSP